MEGKSLELRCEVNPKPLEGEGENGFGTCTLDFPRLTPQPKAISYSDKTGIQSSWTFGVTREGRVPSDLLL